MRFTIYTDIRIPLKDIEPYAPRFQGKFSHGRK